MSDVVEGTVVDEEDVTEENTKAPESQIPEAEYAFIVIGTAGGYTVRPLPEDANVPAPVTMDDIYNACNTVCRNINNQQIAQNIGQSLAAASAAVKEQQDRKPDLVVPRGIRGDDLKVKK